MPKPRLFNSMRKPAAPPSKVFKDKKKYDRRQKKASMQRGDYS